MCILHLTYLIDNLYTKYTFVNPSVYYLKLKSVHNISYDAAVLTNM